MIIFWRLRINGNLNRVLSDGPNDYSFGRIVINESVDAWRSTDNLLRFETAEMCRWNEIYERDQRHNAARRRVLFIARFRRLSSSVSPETQVGIFAYFTSQDNGCPLHKGGCSVSEHLSMSSSFCAPLITFILFALYFNALTRKNISSFLDSRVTRRHDRICIFFCVVATHFLFALR